MREKKFFDSYVEHRSPVQTDAADGAPGAPVEVAAPRAGARALPRRSETAIALYHEGAPAASEWGDELDTSARPDPSDPLRRLFDLLWRRRFIVLPVVLGALLLGLLYSVRARRVYSATATLLVNTSPLASEKRPDSSSASPDAPPTDVPGVDEARRLETQLEIVKTDGVLQAAIQKLDAPQKDAIERFYSLNVGSVRNTDLVTVTVGSPDAGASAALANAICNSYIDRSQKNNRRAIEAAADSARGQLETVRANLNKARDALKNYQGQVGISDGAEQAKNVAQTLETTKADLTQARAAQAAAAATLKVQQDVLANTAREIVSYTTVTRPTVIALRAELTKLRLDRIAARAEYAETSDIVRQLDGQIARVQAQLGREPENETTPAQRAPNPAYITAAQNAASARADLQALRARIPILENNLRRIQTAQAQLPAKTARLTQLANNLAALQTTYDSLGQKAQTLQLSADSQLSNGSLSSPATPPGAPSGRGRNTILLMALMLGSALAYGSALLVDRLDEKIHNAAQAQTASHLPILIDVPRINSRRRPIGLTGQAPFLRESFEMLTAQLALAARETPLRSVLITSALPSEGKSVSCVNLAAAAAWAGEEVVLIDCDGRNPALHEYFGLSNKIGWSDVVLGHARLEDAVQPTRIPGLSVLTAGSPHESPLELLRSVEAQQIIDEVAALADLTILDSPPTLLIADASVLATMTDATLLVVACGEAAKSEIARATTMLQQTGARVLGLVLLKVAPKLGARHSYSEYSSHRATGDLRGPGQRNAGQHADGENGANRNSGDTSIEAGGASYPLARANEEITRPFDPQQPFDDRGGVR